MVIAVLIALWFAILATILGISLSTPKGRAMFKILAHSRKVRITGSACIIATVAIVLVFVFHPAPAAPEQHDARRIFEDYARTLISAMESSGAITIDPQCKTDKPMPELAYTMPALIEIYHEMVNKPTTARLVRLDDTLVLSFDGYKQFKNRTIKITKGVQKRLGPRYTIRMESKDENHTLEITYKGTPWHNEQFCALPAMEAGRRENIDPAMLMSIIRHISGFDFNYERENYGRGLLALDSIDGLEQIFVGARKLRAVLDTAKSEEDAIAAFYPGRDIQGVNAEWRKSPLKNGWVQDVLADIPFYRNNGFSNEPEDL